jgi:hypothetical protein
MNLNRRFPFSRTNRTRGNKTRDRWEREGDSQAYFDRYAAGGYALGVDVVVRVLTH